MSSGGRAHDHQGHTLDDMPQSMEPGSERMSLRAHELGHFAIFPAPPTPPHNHDRDGEEEEEEEEQQQQMKNGDEICIASAAPLGPCLNNVGKILGFLDPLSVSQSREPPFLLSACFDTPSTTNADVILLKWLVSSPLMHCIHLVQQKTTTEEIAICGFCRLRFCRSSQCQNKESIVIRR